MLSALEMSNNISLTQLKDLPSLLFKLITQAQQTSQPFNLLIQLQ